MPRSGKATAGNSEVSCEAAQRAWRRLDGGNQLPKVILGVKFADGLEVTTKPTTTRQPATADPQAVTKNRR